MQRIGFFVVIVILFLIVVLLGCDLFFVSSERGVLDKLKDGLRPRIESIKWEWISEGIRIYGTARDRGQGVKFVWFRFGDEGEFGIVDGTEEWSTNISITQLNDGENVVYVYAEDNSGRFSDTNVMRFMVYLDVKLVVMFPTNNQILRSNSILVKGTAWSYYGISNVFFRLGDNGSFGEVSLSNISVKDVYWETNIFPSEGTNRVWIYALDMMGKYSKTNIVNFIISTNVYLTILSPSNNQVFNTNTNIVVKGTAMSYSGVDGVFLRLGTEGEFKKVEGTTDWNTNLVGLNEGTNEIYVYSVDKVSNYSLTNSVRFIVFFGVSVSITNFTNYQIFNENNIDIFGTARSYYGIKEVWFRLGSSGNFGKVNGTSNWNTNLTSLSEGTNELYFFAVDNLNNVSSTNVVRCIIDKTRPVVSISFPNTNQLFKTNDITVNGTASDNLIGIKEVWFRLGSDGNFSKISETIGWNTNLSWNTNLTGLSEGTNDIYVFVVDNAGNVSLTNNLKFVIAFRVYVSTSGNDSNVGIFKNYPVRSIQAGLSKALVFGFNDIYVSSGLYTPNNGLNSSGSGFVLSNNNMKMVGGWNEQFDSIVGFSELNGNNSLTHIMFASNVQNIVVNNFIFRGGKAIGSGLPDNSGGGIYLSNVNNLILSNIVVVNNISSHFGGGMGLYNVNNSYINGIVSNNISTNGGGGVYFDNSHSNFVNIFVFGNYSITNTGGGIYFYQSHSNIVANKVISNFAVSGGGIYLKQSVGNYIVADIVSNQSTNYGGGIYLDTSYYNIVTNLIAWNRSLTNLGGGIYLTKSEGNVIYSILCSNISSIAGGGLSIVSSTNNVVNAKIFNNVSSNGGGIHLLSSYSNLISGNIFGNIVTNFGGGIYIGNSINNVITNAVVSNNISYFGGGVSIIDSVGNIIVSSGFFSNEATNGGGVYLTNSRYSLIESNSIVSNNARENGGGIYLVNSHSNIINSMVGNNYARTYGGGIYLVNSHSNIVTSVVGSNYAETAGGGVFLDFSTNNIINATIVSNSVGTVGGGGVYLKSGYSNTIMGSIVRNVGRYGGGIRLESSRSNFINAIVFNNYSENGGGIYFHTGSHANTISGNVVSNTATNGGGIYFTGSDTNTISGNVMNNTATSDGGGIYFTGSHTNTISGSVMNNTAARNGGGIYLTGSHTNTVSGNIVGNICGLQGGVYITRSTNIVISSGNIVLNVATNGGSGIYLVGNHTSMLLNLIITNNWGLNTNSVIHITNVNNLVISNCLIGGNNDTDAVGIWEENDILNHRLVNNVFITNRLRYLYREANYSGSVRWITNNSDWTNINVTNLIDSTPDSTNNIVTNL